MAYVSLGPENEIWFPCRPLSIGYARDTTTYVIDANGELAAFIGRIPLNGEIDRFAVNISALTDLPDNGLRLSFQDVNATGFPDGVVGQFATIASGALVVGWNDPGAFDSPRTVNRGEHISLVADFPSFVAGDSVTFVSSYNGFSANTVGFPYGVLNASKQQSRLLQVALHYTDNGGFWVPLTVEQTTFCQSRTGINYDSASSPNSIGNVVQFPWNAKLNKIIVNVTLIGAPSDFGIYVLDAADGLLGGAIFEGNNFIGLNADRYAEIPLNVEIEVTANTPYRVVIRPTSGNNISITAQTQNALLFPYFAGGNIYRTEGDNTIAPWVDYNNSTNGYGFIEMFFGFSAIDIPSGGGGGIGAQIYGG